MDLIYIAKQGEPVLKIHPDALDEHKRLGWQEASAELADKTEKAEKRKADKAAADLAAAEKAEADRLAAEKAEKDRLAAEASKAGGGQK